jgi:hydrogenase large subunit
MGTITAADREAPSKSKQIVEMNWDPITRIVGSLGIFTKIDFANRHVSSATAPRRSFAATAFS